MMRPISDALFDAEQKIERYLADNRAGFLEWPQELRARVVYCKSMHKLHEELDALQRRRLS